MTFKNGFREYALMFTIFGGSMSAAFCWIFQNILTGLLAGLGAGAAFTLLMAMFILLMETSFNKKRQEIVSQRPLYCDGAATLNTVGGWLFYTACGLEFYPYKFNLNRHSLFIPAADMAAVCNNGKRWLVVTVGSGRSFSFLVSSADGWLRVMNAHR